MKITMNGIYVRKMCLNMFDVVVRKKGMKRQNIAKDKLGNRMVFNDIGWARKVTGG